MMTISELIETIGNDKVRFHWMNECTTNVNWSAKTGLTTVTLKTDQPLAPDLGDFRDIGIIVWLPRDEATKLLTEAKKK